MSLRLGFLGCGGAARMHSRTLLRHHPDVARAYASRDVGRAESLAREYGGVAYGSYEAALADPTIDAVLIATPPSTHFSLALAALSAGKHVVVEKPAFPSVADFDTVERAAARAGKRVLVAENYYYKPVAVALRKLLAEGVVGDIRFIAINAIKHQNTGGWRDSSQLAAGGALVEGGVHWINFLANLGPRIERIQSFRADHGALERSSLVVAELAGGGVAALSHSWEVRSPLRGLRLSKIYGTAGSITFESNGVFIAVRARGVRVRFPGLRDMLGYRAMFDDFVHALRGGGQPAMTLALARRDMELLEQAQWPEPVTAGAPPATTASPVRPVPAPRIRPASA